MSTRTILTETRTAKFQIFQSPNDRQYYFRFVAKNGETICHSEGYTTKQSALHGMKVLKQEAPGASTEDLS